MSCNLEILIIQHLRRSEQSQDLIFCFLPEKKLHHWKQANLRNMFQKASKSVCTSTVVVSPDTSSPDPSASLAMKTWENTDDDPEYPEPADGGDTQMEYSSD